MGKVYSGQTPLQPEHDTLSQTPVDGTWYTITDYTSGQGELHFIAVQSNTLNTQELRITIDGDTAHTVDKAAFAILRYACQLDGAGTSNLGISIPWKLPFLTSLKVEVRKDGDTNDINAGVFYGKVV